MNWVAQLCAMIMPNKLRVVAGRGSAKTTEIQVERLIDMVRDMPGAPVAWVADTFANLTANVLPMVFEALERKGFREGHHYVVESNRRRLRIKSAPTFPRGSSHTFGGRSTRSYPTSERLYFTPG